MLGYTVRDRITGFSGVVVGHVRYVSGCHQYLVAPPANPSSGLIASEWFDEQRLEIAREIPRIVLCNSAGAGFDGQAPER